MSLASRRLVFPSLILTLLTGLRLAAGAPWEMVKGDLSTSWAAKVNPQHPLSDYPRPQLVRPQWTNLNGLWDYAVTAKDAARPQVFDGRILVPFGIESALSGVKKPLRPEQRLWYRRTLATPDHSEGQRVLLHFGAVDWQATVFVNGKQVGEHKGGYDGFTIDITDALKPVAKIVSEPPKAVGPQPRTVTAEPAKPEPKKAPEEPPEKAKRPVGAAPQNPQAATAKQPEAKSVVPAAASEASPQPVEKAHRKSRRKDKDKNAASAEKSQKRDDAANKIEANELVLSVWDPTNTGAIACGKQSLDPHGSRYTATSGIWQTVWLEVVPAASIDRLKMTGDVDRGCLHLLAKTRGNARDCTLEVVAKGRNRIAGTTTGRPDEGLCVDIQEVRPWQPDDPFLYELTVALKRGETVVDRVNSYFALRKIEVRRDAAGHDRILLNGRPVFNIGLLDQGFWPDGLYTAPTDEALRFDVESARQMGFNTIRKHVKVEPDRWYYHCDRAGVLVWQDVVSRPVKPEQDTPEARRQFEMELQAMMAALGNHPSIVMWVLFNEGWGAYDQPRLANLIRHRDPTRLVNAHTGGPSQEVGDVVDIHSYCYGTMPPQARGKASVIGELGGVVAIIGGHEWRPKVEWGPGKLKPWEIGMFYEDMANRLKPMIALGLCGAIYTQPYDLESEQNGLLTYDRKVHKVPFELLHEINAGLLRVASLKPQPVVETAERQPQAWRSTTERPKGDWTSPHFEAAGWASGAAPFGTVAAARTRWSSPDIWLRRTIDLRRPLKVPAIEILRGGDAEVYIDGRLAAALVGFNSEYGIEPVRPEAAGLLTSGQHVLSVHCRQDAANGRREVTASIDVGVVDLRAVGTAPAAMAHPLPLLPPTDTHYAPGGKWLEHDILRPRPPVVDTLSVSNLGLLAKAPSDAVVLFDGKDLSQWASFESGLTGPATWKVENGYMEIAPHSGNIYSREKFGDCQIHIEWASPADVKGDGQGRGNSGIFPLGFGEIQVLDSWKNDTYPDGEAGGIYGKFPPLVNSARPAGVWQAYDIVIHLARLDKQGRVVQPARMTMFHNGVVIHHALELAGRQQAGTIGLQDHHNPVRYRNIWVRKLVDYDVAGMPPPGRGQK